MLKKIFILVFALLSVTAMRAEVISVCGNDTVLLQVENYKGGLVEWQQSVDTLTWTSISGANGVSYKFYPTQAMYYRAIVKTAECPPLYSAISKVEKPPLAFAGADRLAGTPSISLMGNTDANATGEWTILSGTGGSLDDATNPRATFSGENGQSYSLKWTLTNACGQSSDTVQVSFDFLVSKHNFIVVDNTDSIYSDSTEMAAGVYRIRFSDTSIAPYDSVMLIGMRQDMSFLRKVTAFSKSGEIYRFQTKQGTLPDLISSGVFNIGDGINQSIAADTLQLRSAKAFPTRETLSGYKNNQGIRVLYSNTSYESPQPANLRTASTAKNDAMQLDISEKELFSNSIASLTLKDSYIKIDPNFVFDCSYKAPASISNIRFGVNNALLEYNYVLEWAVSAAYSYEVKDKKLVEAEKTICIMAGEIPVIVNIDFAINASFSFSAEAKAALEQTKNCKLNLTALIKGNDPANLQLQKSASKTVTHKDEVSQQATLSSELEIGPELSFMLYGVFGPYLNVPLKLEGNVCANAQKNWDAKASATYEGNIGLQAEVLGNTLFNVDKKLVDNVIAVDTLPYKLEYISGDNQKGKAGEALAKPVVLKVVDKHGRPVQYVPVHLKTETGVVLDTALRTDKDGLLKVKWTLGSGTPQKLKVSVLDCNNSDVKNSPYYIHANTGLTAGFKTNKSSPAVNENIQFTDTTKGKPNTWRWNFGDGSTSAAQHPAHTYAKAGSYTVSLAVSDSTGTETSYYTIKVGKGVWINGVLWATCNVATPGCFAASPEAAGCFYQWNSSVAWPATGAVSGWNCRWNGGYNPGSASDTWTRANDPSPAGYRVPTREEIESLTNTTYVSLTWTTQNGVNGTKITDISNGNSIFLPASGYRHNYDGTLDYGGSSGGYWSSTAYSSNTAYSFFCSADWDGDRMLGRTVRPVAE